VVTDKGRKDTTGTAARGAKGLAVEVDRDNAKPAATEVGPLAGGITKLLVRPLRKLVDGASAALDRLARDVQNELAHVPSSRQLPPPATIAGPAALHYAMLGDGAAAAVLREMFAKLLATSMDIATVGSAHPAFVAVISQLTPDDAWLLKSIDRAQYPAVKVATAAHGERPFVICTTLGDELGFSEPRLHRALDNLDRLGVLAIDWARSAPERRAYDTIHARVRALYPTATSTIAGVISAPAFGEQFLAACVGSSEERSGDGNEGSAGPYR
jgi:hypothetical protein